MLLLLAPVSEDNPERARDENRRVAADGEADEQGKREVFRRVAAEEVEGGRREEDGEDRVERTRQRLIDTAVDELVDVAAAAEVQLEVLADAVEDDDRIVDRVTDDGQQCCDERGINLALRQREDREHDEDIVDEREDGGDAKAQLKAVGDVEDNQCPRDDECQDGIRDELTANRRADFLLTQDFVVTDIALERRHDFLALVLLEVARADHDVFRFLDVRLCARQLDGRIVEVVLCEARADLCDADRLVELEVNDGTAGKVDTEVEAADGHADEARDDDQSGNEEPDFPMTCYIEFKHPSSNPPFSDPLFSRA